MANPHSGEVTIELVRNGQRRAFTLRPTWQAMVEIEESTGRSLVEIVRRAATGNLGFRESGVIVAAGMKAAGEPARLDPVLEMIFETGLTEAIPAVLGFLTNALNGGKKPGEAEAAETEPSTTAASSALPAA